MSQARWPRLFSPLPLGPLTLPNRIIMPGMDPSLADADGYTTPAMIQHYVDRAKGGAGLLVTGNIACEPIGRVSPWMPLISDDSYLPGLTQLADAVHQAGSLIFVQISHAGRQTLEDFAQGQPVSASPIPCPVMRSRPRALSDSEIEATIDRFADAALRAQRAGMDGVEFHMAHGYLVCQFLSPYSNHRTDRWGGDAEGRARFAIAIIERARHRVGPDFPLQCRLSADERVPGGIEPPLALEYAHRLVAAGATSLSISACNYESYRYNMPSYYMPLATYAPLAKGIRDGLKDVGVTVPIIAVGRFADGDLAEKSLTNGDADLIAFGRSLIADPDLPRLLQSGDSAQVRPCVHCNRCAESITRGPLRCLVNPQAGHPPTLLPTIGHPQDILVIGGGPAGVTAAVEAAKRGHHVRLIEASDQLGGKAWASGVPPKKERFSAYAQWLSTQAQVAGVQVTLGRRLSVDEIKRDPADVILLAVGAQPNPAPPIPGLAHQVVLHPEAALQDQTPRQHVLVIGGGPEGCEVADAIAHRPERPRVTIVERRRKIGLGLPSSVRALLEERLRAAQVYLETRVTIAHFDSSGVQLIDRRGRDKGTLPPADLVILAIGVQPPAEWSALEDDDRVQKIGDALTPATILEAVACGWRIGRTI